MQVMVTIPKKKRKHAVDRVQMRRRTREAYRLNRIYLRSLIEINPHIKTLSISLIYIHDKNLPYLIVEDKMKTLLDKLITKIQGKDI